MEGFIFTNQFNKGKKVNNIRISANFTIYLQFYCRCYDFYIDRRTHSHKQKLKQLEEVLTGLKKLRYEEEVPWKTLNE